MDLGLADLVDGRWIVQIDADSLPTPPHVNPPGILLLVNCHYGVEVSGETDRADLYYRARSHALEIVRQLATKPTIAEFLSVNVRVIGHFPYPNMSRPAIRRIYAVSLEPRQLILIAEQIAADNLTSIGAFEESQLADAPSPYASVAPPGL